MRATIYDSRHGAEAMQRDLDAMFGYPREHAEGVGEDDFVLARPGRAAERIRSRGVRTQHYAPILEHPDASRFAVPNESPHATSLDDTWRAGRPLDRR